MTAPLTDLPGIGPATSQLFVEAGFATIESIANTDPADLEQVKGIGPHRAVALRTVARERTAVGTVNQPSTSLAGASNGTTATTDKGKKSKGKKSKGKKSKGKKSKGKKSKGKKSKGKKSKGKKSKGKKSKGKKSKGKNK